LTDSPAVFFGVRFATGMNGDEDLGQDITMKGEKFHYNQSSFVQLPLCDGSNGVVGLDCQSTGGYPKKTAGRPWAPMNDAYPPGHPRYASRIQLQGEDEAFCSRGWREYPKGQG
jgi:hypothetical protein